MSKQSKKRTPEQILERDDAGRKKCYDCFAWKPEASFARRSLELDGLARICRDCRVVQRVTSQYNVAASHVRRLVQDADGICPLCLGALGVWHVDHDHDCCDTKKSSCGKCVRGILCGRCNVGLAMFRDNAESLARAAVYLRTRRSKNAAPF